MEDRISLEEAIDEIYKLQRREINFPVESLEGSPSSRKLLASITAKCERIPENEKLFRRLLERLERLHIAVAPLAAEDQRKKQYVDITLLFLQLVKYKPLLERLAKCEIVRERIFHLQLRLTEVGKEVNVAELPTWIEDWDDDCENQFSKLSQLEANSSERGLVKRLCGKKKVQEALFALKRSIGKRGQSVEMKQLKEATYARVEAYSNQAGLHLFDWFISRDEIEYNDKVIEAEVDFLDQLELWWNLPRNTHILKLYGVSHVSTPPLIVLEYASNGNLAQFLGRGEHKQLFWSIFLLVAEGLVFLHDNGIAHGSLKCNNILVDEAQIVKLSDFGFHTSRALSSSLSFKGGLADASSARWKPEEVLRPDADRPGFEADIYAIGMCMIEAMTQEAPFGSREDDDVMKRIISGNSLRDQMKLQIRLGA
ncbi:Protein kinase-like domain [Phytophthora cactorum]|nr:Protein kinase-like domain [Phytophthora cactorum]